MTNITLPIATQIEEAVKNTPGWSPFDQLLALFTLVYSSSYLSGDILEVGSWCGRSSVAMGLAAKLSGGTKVHCVDLFPEKKDWCKNADGTYSFTVNIDGRLVGAYGAQTVWAEPYNRDIAPVYERYSGTLEAFNETVSDNRLNDYITPFKGDLQEFAAKIHSNFRLRMAFIDGDHSYEAVAKDIEITKLFLLPEGWICFDDAFSSYKGVDQAIEDYVIKSGNFRQCQQLTRKLFIAKYNG